MKLVLSQKLVLGVSSVIGNAFARTRHSFEMIPVWGEKIKALPETEKLLKDIENTLKFKEDFNDFESSAMKIVTVEDGVEVTINDDFIIEAIQLRYDFAVDAVNSVTPLILAMGGTLKNLLTATIKKEIALQQKWK